MAASHLTWRRSPAGVMAFVWLICLAPSMPARAQLPYDITPPDLASSVPADGETNFRPEQPIQLTFTEPVNFNTFRPPGQDPDPSFQLLYANGTPVTGITWSVTPSVDLRTLTLSHEPRFSESTSYKLRLLGMQESANAVQDTAGLRLQNTREISFTVGANFAPTIMATQPPDGYGFPGGDANNIDLVQAASVPNDRRWDPAAPIVLKFSKTMDPTTFAVDLHRRWWDGTAWKTTPVPGISYSWNADNSVVTISHSYLQTSNMSDYELVVTSAMDLGGRNLLPGALADGVLNFRTKDQEPPTFIGSFPENGAVIGDLRSPITLTFSEPINVSALKLPALGVSSPSVQLLIGEGPVPDMGWTVTPSADRRTLTLNHTALFTGQTTYKFRIYGRTDSDTAIQDIAGNKLQTTAEFIFSVSDLPPSIVATVPTDGYGMPAPGQSDSSVRNDSRFDPNQPIVIRFSEPVDPASFAMQFRRSSDGAAVGGISLAWSQNNTVVTISHNPLDTSTASDYELKILSAKDLAGLDLTTGVLPNNTLHFRTKDLVAPSVTATSPPNGTTIAQMDQPIVVTFSRPIDPSSFKTPNQDAANPSFRVLIGSTPVADISWTVQPSADGLSFTLLHDVGFQGEQTYRVQVLGAQDSANAPMDLVGNRLPATFEFSFTLGGSAPTVVATDPPSNFGFPGGDANNVDPVAAATVPNTSRWDPTAPIQIRFSTVMYVPSFAYELRRRWKEAGVWKTETVPNTTAIWNTNRTSVSISHPPLAAENTSDYELVITSAADRFGKTLAPGALPDNTLRFRTQDLQPPSLVGSSPSNGQTAVAKDAPITLTFSEPIKLSALKTPNQDPANPSFRLFVSNAEQTGITWTATASPNGMAVTLNHDTNLRGSTTYRLHILGLAETSNPVQDGVGNSIAAPIDILFTTKAGVQPSIVATSPAQGYGFPGGDPNNTDVVAAASVGNDRRWDPAAPIVVTFSAPVDPASFAVALQKRQRNGDGWARTPVGGIAVTWSAANTVASIAHDYLEAGNASDYELAITAARGPDGDPMTAGVLGADNTLWFRTRDLQPPSLASVLPPNDSAVEIDDKANNNQLAISFTEPVLVQADVTGPTLSLRYADGATAPSIAAEDATQLAPGLFRLDKPAAWSQDRTSVVLDVAPIVPNDPTHPARYLPNEMLIAKVESATDLQGNTGVMPGAIPNPWTVRTGAPAPLSIADASGAPGTLVPVTLQATDSFQGVHRVSVSVCVSAPTGASPAALSTVVTPKGLFAAAKATVVAQSPTEITLVLDNATAAAGPGELATMAVSLPPDAPVGARYILTVTSASVSVAGKVSPASGTGAYVTVRSAVVKGDVNGDGKVTVADASLALRMAVGIIQPKPEQLLAGDIDGNGKLSVVDVTKILSMAIGLTKA